MAVNAEWLHFAQVTILSFSVHLSNLVSLDAQVQKRWVTTDFTLTLTLTLVYLQDNRNKEWDQVKSFAFVGMILRATSAQPSGRSERRRTYLTSLWAEAPGRSKHTNWFCLLVLLSSRLSWCRTLTSTLSSTSRGWSAVTCRLSSASCTMERLTLPRRN